MVRFVAPDILDAMTRRSAVSKLVICLPALFLSRTSIAQPNNGSNQETIANWMGAWMGVGRPVSGSLHLMRFKDPIYALTRPIAWKAQAGAVGNLPEVAVPAGFVTDFASIPRLFWSLLRPDGEYTYAAIIHDYLYWTQTSGRETADEVFRLAMEDFSVDRKSADAIYSAVRTFGGTAWDSNRRLREAGERRVLRRLPEDPRVTWAEWKLEPGVFEQ